MFQHFLQAEVRYELRDKDELMFGDAECVFQAYHKVCFVEAIKSNVKIFQ